MIKNAKMAGKKGLSEEEILRRDEEILRRLEESDSDNFSDLLSDTDSNDSDSEEEDNERPPIDVIPEKRIPTQSSGDENPSQISKTHILHNHICFMLVALFRCKLLDTLQIFCHENYRDC